MRTDVDHLREALHFVPPDEREIWLRMGMAIKFELGDSGFDLWNTWSQQADSYEAKAARDVWKSIRSAGKVTVGTLFHEARKNGWRGDGTQQKPTPEEIAKLQRIAAERAAQEEARTASERAEAAEKSTEVWRVTTEAKPDHPYLARKQVSPVATLREIDAGAAAAILGYAPKSSGEHLVGRLLVAPVRIGHGLSTLELIDEVGRKSAVYGGAKAGGYWAAQPLPDGDGSGLTLQIGEGVATVLSAKKSTGDPAVAALSSGNMAAVAKAMRERYPAAALVILADLVKGTGEPDPHAADAARSVGGRLAIPDFGTDRDPGMTDFNDLMTLAGPDAVRQTIGRASEPAMSSKNIRNSSSKWPDPQPLTVKVAPEPYPIDALPDTIRSAVEEVAGFVKAPMPLVASSALAALSLACQAHIDVKRAEKLHGPTGLFLLTIADSGERKSTCDGFFTGAIRDYEEAQAEAAKPILKDHKAAFEAWEAKRGGIKEKIRHLAKDNKPTVGVESALRDLEHEKPEPPRVPRLLYADATPEALAYGLAKQWPSGGVVSAEAGIVFGSHGMGKDSVMRNLSLLNQLWDGTSLTIDRRSTESFTVRGARLTVALQVQEPTLREFFTRSGALARGTGFLARFLVAWPESTQGHRPFTEAPTNWTSLAAFHRRIATILNQAVPMDEDGALTPAMLSLAPEAKAAWVEYHDAIESKLASGGELHEVQDVASKSADNAARLAALLQIFEHGMGGAVGLDCFERASMITAWHLHEARRFFGELALPPELVDAARLDDWLIAYCQQERTQVIPKNHARQHGPLRDGARLDAAIRELGGLDHLRLEKEGKRLTIHLNPVLVGVTP